MAAIIRSTCDDCGQVDIKAENVKLVRGERVTYKFTCPKCGQVVSKATDETIVGLLLTGGVEFEVDDTPVAVFHPEDPDLSAPLFTPDDVLKLHEELEDM